MKILIVSNYLYPETGAASNRITQMAEALSKNFEVSVVTALPNYPTGKVFLEYKGRFFMKEKIKNFDVRRYRTYNSNSKNAIKRMASMLSLGFMMLFEIKYLVRERYDIVIVQNSPLLVSSFAILYTKMFSNSKIVLNVSDLWPLSALELGAIKKGRFYNFLERIEKFNYTRSGLIIGQSNEIIGYVKNLAQTKQFFLYRNIPRIDENTKKKHAKNKPVRIVYAGLLGVAQGVLDVCKKINFKELDVEFHIYGMGNELNNILKYLNYSDCNIYYKGSVSSNEIKNVLVEYDFSIVPLKNRIYGAVPSKIFELTLLNIPIIFCGGGEGAQIVRKHKIGFVSDPGDYQKLEENIYTAVNLSDKKYKELVDNCCKAANVKFDFSNQMEEFVEKLTLFSSKD
ncbi:MAG: glycosyltransferase family 4 protein [Oleispira sp.]|nr:glycosyltransferase family 4 protein [Oleispira sp.]